MLEFFKLKDGTVVAATETYKKEEVAEKLTIKTQDVGYEKHVPFVELINHKISSRTGKDVMHPATAEHHIVWFKLVQNDKVVETVYLKNPTDLPKVSFKTQLTGDFEVYIFCNLHGVWVGRLNG